MSIKDIRVLLVNDFKLGGGAEKVFIDTFDIIKKEANADIFFGIEKIRKPKDPLSYIYSKEFFYLFLEKLTDFKPHIVHLHNYYHYLSPSILDSIRTYRKKYNLKVVMTCHDYHILAPNSGFTYFNWISNKIVKLKTLPNNFDIFFKKWDRRGISFSLLKQFQWIFNYKIKKLQDEIDYFISPSNFLANFISEKFNKKVYIVRNPIKLNLDYKNIKSILLKHSERIKKIVFAGRLSPEKGLIEFIKKYEKLFLENNDILFYIIGEGEEFEKIKNFIGKNNLSKKVVLLGRLPNEKVVNILKKSHALVLPSIWYENAPLSLVEGALYGCKLITQSYGGMGEIANICGNYLFIDKSTTEDLNRFLNNNAFDYNTKVSKIFSLDNYKKNILKIYKEILYE